MIPYLPYSSPTQKKLQKQLIIFNLVTVSFLLLKVLQLRLFNDTETKSLHPISTEIVSTHLIEKNKVETVPIEANNMQVLDLPPSTKNVIINIGSHVDPIMPDEEFGPCARTIAVEPIVSCKIPPHSQLNVIPAAVADKAGVMTMRTYNSGMSSSLANIAKEDYWNKKGKGDNGKLVIVPVITLSSLLNSIPSFTNISLLMTDMQGLDFVTVKAGAQTLKDKVTHLITEVWLKDSYTYDAKNDLCRDWMPFMEELGELLNNCIMSFQIRKKTKSFRSTANTCRTNRLHTYQDY